MLWRCADFWFSTPCTVHLRPQMVSCRLMLCPRVFATELPSGQQLKAHIPGHSTLQVIGDGAITGGMAYEAMNHAGFLDTNMLVILNDNQQVCNDCCPPERVCALWGSKLLCEHWVGSNLSCLSQCRCRCPPSTTGRIRSPWVPCPLLWPVCR